MPNERRNAPVLTTAMFRWGSYHKIDGLTIIMVTHERDMAEYARRLIWMVDGKVETDHLTAKGAA